MASATQESLDLTPDVRDFLRAHAAEDALAKVCEIVRECYPHFQDMRFRLLDDPDEDGRVWCVIEITLPTGEADAGRVARWKRYHGRVAEGLPFASAQCFGLSVRYAQD